MPIDITANGRTIGSLGPGSGSLDANGTSIFYGGDDCRGFGVKYNGQPVPGGSDVVETQTLKVIVLRSRLVKPIEKGQPITLVSDLVEIKYRRE